MNFPVDDNIATISSDHQPASTIVSFDSKSVTCKMARLDEFELALFTRI